MPRRARPTPTPSVDPRTGRVADGEESRPVVHRPGGVLGAGGSSCAALPPLGTQLAQLLLVGSPAPGPAGQPGLVDRGVGGLLLFRANVVSAGQVRALVAALKDQAEIPLEVAVDQGPGTRVARLAGIVRAAPSARELGRLPADRVERYGRATGRDLAALGVTADLAPVLDVTGARWDEVIGDRSFGADPATVSRAAVAFLRGLAAGGVAPWASTSPATAPPPSTPTTGCRWWPRPWPASTPTTWPRSGPPSAPAWTRSWSATWSSAPSTPATRPPCPRRWSAASSATAWASTAWSSPTPWRWAPSPAPCRSRSPPSSPAAGVDQLVLSGHSRVPAVLDHLERAVAGGRISRAGPRGLPPGHALQAGRPLGRLLTVRQPR